MLQQTSIPEVEFTPRLTDFRLAEFLALHSEVNVKLNTIDENVRFLMGGVTAAWAWLLTDRQFETHPHSLLPYLPVIFSILFGVVIFRQMKYVLVQGDYLATVEQEYAHDRLGWEAYRNSHDRTGEWRVHKVTISLLVLIQIGVILWFKRDVYPFNALIDWVAAHLSYR